MVLVLGSQSPRRKEILSYFSIPFIQKVSLFEDHHTCSHEDPWMYASFLAEGKAFSLQEECPQHIILTADTLVYCEGKILEKPLTQEHGYEMLLFLSGKHHAVITAVSVLHEGKCTTQCATTEVEFAAIDQKQAKLYFAACGGLDKSGGYCIQNQGSIIIKKIKGCFYNVLGLPIHTTATLLQTAGINLWEFLS